MDVRADVNSFLKRSKGGSSVNPCGAGVKGKAVEPVAGHIPGAVMVRWSLLTTQRPVAGQKTDGWLPESADFERLMQKSGVSKDASIVITYSGQLLDVREPAGYPGVAHRIAAVDPQWYGHIPGATNLPMTLLSNDVGPAALLFDSETLGRTLTLLGVDPTAPSVVYCNSGIMASLGWFVISELLGNSEVRLYDGSMQEWAMEKMPVTALKRD